ncbi:MAG: prepilin-type N-terminal cleavage/methylation domain-containing protein [Gammaproteobacteria bacterium]|nr:prepilin-type N-terminal cleavage/methylation domain-containing protein [Gammaproteobacteria bacterium]
MMFTFKQQRGFNLVELMIALVVGLFLVAGALRIYTQSQTAIQVNESIARIQETARFAMGIIEKDVRAAELWGRTNNPLAINGSGEPAAADIYGVTSHCEPNWSVHVARAIEGANNSNPYAGSCIPSTAYQPGSDVLVVRHADEVEVATADLQPGVIYLRSNSNFGQIFVGTTEPTNVSVDAVNNALVSVAYWISNRSDNDPSVPSLRRSFLGAVGGNPTIINEEVISGVEDMQVQYGIDTTGDNSVNTYVDFDDVTNTDAIMVARVWIRVRAENAEMGFKDDATFIYADSRFRALDIAGGATVDADIEKYRRVLVTKTMELRNRRADRLTVAAAAP